MCLMVSKAAYFELRRPLCESKISVKLIPAIRQCTL